MIAPRWRKVVADLWGNKTRTLLVVLSIAVGVFAVGMIAGSHVIMTRDLRTQYLATSPSSAQIFTRDPFDEELVSVIRRMRGVRDADGRRTVSVRYSIGPGQWREMQLIALRDYKDIRVNKIWPTVGPWPPPNHEVLVERSSVAALGARIGDELLIETPDGTRRRLRIAGIVHDLSQISTFFRGLAYGYISMPTLEWLGETHDFNQVNFVVADRAADKAHVEAVAARVRNKIEGSGREVFFTFVFEPGRHWADDSLQAVSILLGVLGALSLLLSGFLVINTISSLLTQQIRQIGIMKAIGARADQIMGLYLTTVVGFGLLSLVVAVPLGVLGARAMSAYVAQLLNFEISKLSLPPVVFGLEVAAGLVVPVLAALYPIIGGTRITVREAIGERGLSGRPGRGLIDRLISRVQGLSRPMLLSLRNTFRRKGRLVLTLVTLTLAGAIFMGIMSVQASLMGLMEDLFRYWNYDLQIEFNRPYRVERVEWEAQRVPGVVKAESWGFRSSQRIRGDGTESEAVFLITLPAATEMLQPILLRGRWLLPEDESAVVINSDLVKNEPDLDVGDEILLRIGTRETTWRVVGVVQGILAGPLAYVNAPYASRVMRTYGRADRIQLVTDRHDGASTSQISQAVEARFRRLGLRMSANQTTSDLRRQARAQFNVIIVFLMIMAILLAAVGGLGLMGTMSINVLERTREIGVMRAVGASDRAVLQIVMGEGVLIGVLSWAIAVVLALPLGYALSNAVGQAFLKLTPAFRFSFTGVLIWLGLVILLAAVASFLPAWNASRLTVRDVLAYE